MQLFTLLLMVLTFRPYSREILEIRTADGLETLQYDPTRVSHADLERWAQLSTDVSSDNFYLVPESLELCIDKSADYAHCGSRDLQDPHFFRNAKLNLRRIQRRISLLDSGRYPEQLKPAVEYYKRIQTFFLAAYSVELRYLRDWDPSVLVFTIDGINYGQECASAINDLRATKERAAAYKLVTTEWVNCVNHSFREKLGPYPDAAWRQFLETYSIDEKFVPREVPN
jgi:hypothetical protein